MLQQLKEVAGSLGLMKVGVTATTVTVTYWETATAVVQTTVVTWAQAQAQPSAPAVVKTTPSCQAATEGKRVVHPSQASSDAAAVVAFAVEAYEVKVPGMASVRIWYMIVGRCSYSATLYK